MSEVGSQMWSATLVARLRAGDAGAGEALEAGLRPRLLGFALRFVPGDRAAAEDLVQEAFVRALAADVAPEDLRAWCFRVVRNLALKALDKAGREAPWPTGFERARETLGPLTRVVEVEDAARLEAQLARLSPAQREALVLRYVEGLGRAEIATVLDVEVSVVKSRLFEGLARLRQLAAPDEPT